MSTLMNSGSSPLCARPGATYWRHQIGSPDGAVRPAALTRRAFSPCTTARMLDPPGGAVGSLPA